MEKNLNLSLVVSEDGMVAEVKSLAPNPLSVSIEYLTDLLNRNGVTCGIDMDALKAISEKGMNPDERIVVARGTPPVKGEDAQLIFCFRKKHVQKEQTRRQSFNSKLYKLAKKNEVLVVKLKPTNGYSGLDVFGNEIAPEAGKDVAFQPGKNVQARYYPDKIEYSAFCEGIVNIQEEKLEVSSLCVIDHDVDLSTGNIEFVGSLLILGNVHRGFKVSSQGSIKVQGIVDGAILTAENDVEVSGNITGSSIIRAGGNVKAELIEHSQVEADGDILVQEGVLNSELVCSGRVVVTKGRGIISGGIIRAEKGVEAKILGSVLGTITRVAIGDKFTKNRNYIRMEEELNVIESEIKRLQSTLKPFVGKDPTLGTISSDKMWALKSLANRLKELKSKREYLNRRMAAFDQITKSTQSHQPKILAKKKLYKGVIIEIRGDRMTFDHELDEVAIFKSPSTKNITVVSINDI